MGGRWVGARHGGGTTESFDARSGHDRPGDMDGLKSDSASFWSRCIFFHKSATPRRQTRETKKSNNQLSKQKKIGVIRLLSTTSTSHKTPTHSLCALRLSYLSSSSCTCSHRVSTLCSCAREHDGNFQPFVNFVQSMECPFV